MKKSDLFKRSCFLLSSALMVSGAFLATGCSNEVEGTDNGPSNLTGEAVKTQFSISIPYTGNANTRMTDENTQAAGNFLGMQDIRLIPYALGKDVDGSSLMDRGVVINLTSFDSFESTNSNNNSAKVYDDVEIEVGTDRFLFYGQAKNTTNNAGQTQGWLDNTIPSEGKWTDAVSTIEFKLKSITSQTLSGYSIATDYATYLNNILVADWKTVSGADDASLTAKSKELKALYGNFTKLQAGSAVGIHAAVTDLYNALDGYIVSTETATGSVTVSAIADAIRTAITTGISGKFSFSATDSYPYTLNATYTDAEYGTFPKNLGLPEGAVQVSYTAGSQNTFAYVAGGYNNANFGAPALASYVYPAALWYFANSTIKCSNSSQKGNYTQTADDSGWSNVLGNYSNGSSVTVGTRSIAMVNRIKYGVGRLESRVVFKEGQTIYDNNPADPTNGSPVTIPTGGFLVTGILVGGQKNVDWKFQPTSTSANFTIYDNQMNGTTNYVAKQQVIGNAPVNHTLVLETATTTDEVHVAIELVNNSSRVIYGVGNGIIPVGSTFYLVGTLNKAATGGNSNASNGATSIFQQAYVTVANFTIGSLKNAYNVLPDLRASQLELGLSVDLSWKAGYSFNVTID